MEKKTRDKPASKGADKRSTFKTSKATTASTSRRNLSQESEELAAKDDRFAHILKNPIYRGVPKRDKKVDIDKRFQSMFSDDKFKLKYKVDKRGRPVNTTTDENLIKYYNLVEDEEEKGENSGDDEEKPEIKDEPKSEDEGDSSSSSPENDEVEEVKVEGDIDEEDVINTRPSNSKVKLSEEVRKKLRDADVDYARGEGNFVSDESSDGASSDEEAESDVEHEWGEMDKEATRTEESTNRLALCNMDWDRLKAVDLMVLFTSFLPAGGVLKTISIYTSDFGKQRMAEEELSGPLELKEFKKEMNSDDEEETVIDYGGSDHEEDEEEGSAYHREKLRKYQLNRLRYFYAILEFDRKETAEAVYSECDGMEYESSAAKIDLRFIPEDMTFDDKPRDKCETLPENGKYRPKFFTTTALQQVKVDCTWDETDPSRKDMIDRVFNSTDKVDDEDIKAYLASSSESEEDDLGEDQENGADDTVSVSSVDPIAKYRALLDSIEKTEKKKKEKDVELEITWGVGLKKKTEDLVKKKLEEKDGISMTPWEEQLAKLKDKKKLKKVAKKSKGDKGSDDDSNSGSSGDDEEDDQPFSDDDVDVDLNDEFFQNEMRNNEVFQNSKKPKKKVYKERKDEAVSDPKSSAELELLLMDDEGEGHKNHFNLKKIIEGENDSKSKKKRKFKKAKKDPTVKPDTKDDFDVDVSDNRFSALFTSHHYNIDPSDPNFKKTNAMEKIIGEKQKRRTKGEFDEEIPGGKARKTVKETVEVQHSQQSATKKAELSYLVKSIKRNTMNIRKVKQQKRQKS